MVAPKLAICNGVSVTSPCPMEILMMVSPFHELGKLCRRRLHWG